MRHERRPAPARLSLLLAGLALAATPAAAQDPVTIDQVRITGAPAQPRGLAQDRFREAEYILGGQAAAGLMSPSGPAYGPAANQARAFQTGTGNASTIDMSGTGNSALQVVTGARNSVTQIQAGDQNSSTVTVFGNANTVGTRQEGSGADATITVRGNNNAVTAQQQGSNPLPVSITQVGNGGNVSVSRSGR
ncbi:hypothetical protein [Methylobacterium sp. A54F]